MQVFSRYTPATERSFALKAFNAHETEINQHYWSFKVISEYAGFLARNQRSTNANAKTELLFHASGPDARRIPPTVSGWLDANEELNNWLRLSAIVSASSYLETYFRQVIRTALMSDPLCRFGASKTCDGTILLKNGCEIPFEKDIESITKGDWTSRCNAFNSIFGSIPSNLKSGIGVLEKIRKIRNDYAHGFGRGLDVPLPSEFNGAKSKEISQRTFVRYLGVISKVASSVDEYLMNNHIGGFEIIHYYHRWVEMDVPKEDRRYEKDRAFQRSLNRDARVVLSTEYCNNVIAHYDSVG